MEVLTVPTIEVTTIGAVYGIEQKVLSIDRKGLASTIL